MSLGNEADVTLAEAREPRATLAASWTLAGTPSRPGMRPSARRQATAMTFREVAALYIAAHEDAWRNAKHRAQWRSTLDTYAGPELGKLPVGKVGGARHGGSGTDLAGQAGNRIALTRPDRGGARLRYGAWLAERREPGALEGAPCQPPAEAQQDRHGGAPCGAALGRGPGLHARARGAEGHGALALVYILTAARTSEVTGATWARSISRRRSGRCRHRE